MKPLEVCMPRDIREKYEAWWRCEGSILRFDTPKKHHAPPRIPSEVQDVGWLLAYVAERWVKEAKKPDWDWIWEVYHTSWDGTYFGGEAYPQVWLNLGPGIMAAYLDGYADFRGDTMWFELSEPLTWEEIGKLNYDPENPWWRFTLEAAHELGMRAKGKGDILGTTDIGGIHDVLASLRGSGNIMTDFYDHAQELQREADRILPLWHRYYHELDQVISLYQNGRDAWMHIYSELRWYPIQCDLAYMLSPEMFEKFVVPVIEGHCKMLERTIYHLDGEGQLAHLKYLLEIPELDGIQWVPGAGSPTCGDPCWFPYYRRIQEKGKLLVLGGVLPEQLDELMDGISPEGVLVSIWVRDVETAEEIEKRFGRLGDL
ncbi:MAG: hypothetical protein KAT86_03885, partial [Candidatus Latescibacteria bacterium]|nr:hypothetical protein [Candidatus Latescibacterota bacterium]